MRLFPIVTAVLVCAVLYAVVMERQVLVDFAARFGPAPEAATVAAPDTASDPAPAATPRSEDDRSVSVVARRSQAREVDTAVLLRGRTEAARQVEVRAETSGLVVSPPIRAGAFVEQGQLLCEVDPGTRLIAVEEAQAALAEARARLPEAEARVPEARARREEARAQLTAAEIDFNAASRLNESGFASETRAATAAATMRAAEAAVESATAGVQSAEAGIEGVASGIRSAEAAVSRAEQEIQRLQIMAPFAGHLESDTAELGALLQPGSLCATIIQLDPIKLVGFVPETQVDRVAAGAGAGARLTSGSEVQGLVTFLSRSADPQTRTFRVEITVANPDLAIRDGQTADILISSAGQQAHLLPSSALTLNDSGVLGLRIVDADNIARFAPVTLLRDTAQGVLLSGLPDQVDVITVGQEYVTHGTRVTPTYEELTQ